MVQKTKHIAQLYNRNIESGLQMPDFYLFTFVFYLCRNLKPETWNMERGTWNQKMWRCEDVNLKICQFENVTIWKFEDVEMRRWEDVWIRGKMQNEKWKMKNKKYLLTPLRQAQGRLLRILMWPKVPTIRLLPIFNGAHEIAALTSLSCGSKNETHSTTLQ